MNTQTHQKNIVPAPSPTRADQAARFALALSACALVLVPAAGRADLLNLANSPLFLSTSVPSNTFFLNDDSAGMDWALATPDTDGVMMTAGNCTYYYTHPTPNLTVGANAPAKNNSGDANGAAQGGVVPTEEYVVNTLAVPNPGVWRAWNKNYNKLYYDPETRYRPWKGVDANGVAFANVAANAAPYNPYRPANPNNDGNIDLTATTSYTTKYCPKDDTTFTIPSTGSYAYYPARYYTWTDSNSNGVVDAADTHALVEIKSGNAPFVRTSGKRTDCANPLSCTYTEEIKNFANWFSYHRKRDLAAKQVAGTVIGRAGAEARMGLATLHNLDSNNTNVAQMNASASTGNKKALLDALYRVRPSGSGVPLRTRLDAVGKYFECVTDNILGASGATCPILPAADGGACQQNFTVVTTHGKWDDSFTGPGNTDEDGPGSFDGGAYADSYSNTLADIAMHYYERDLATNLSNAVPVTAGVDTATHQHMVTYALALGASGTLSANPPNAQNSFTWPDPLAATTSHRTKIDDLRHAAYNGRGQFLNTSDPQGLAAVLQDTQDILSDRLGSAAAVAVNSRSFSTSTRLYQARFTSGKWTGDLRALSLDSAGAVNSGVVWSAAEALEDKDWDERIILTHRRTGALGGCAESTGTQGGVAFLWNNLSATQQCMLNDNPATTTLADSDTKGSLRLRYIRGDVDDADDNGFREFDDDDDSWLGDIVNSGPIHVGAPPFLPDMEAVAHASFRSTYANRREMVYVGANDGMLHGFAAATGEERIAYVPSMVYPDLNQLTNPAYAHRYYVDGSPTVGDAFGAFTNVSGSACPTGGCWRTVLVGVLAGGGKGAFALDVTDPDGATVVDLKFLEANAAKIALWEFLDSASATAGDDMGFVYGEATIVKMKNGKWAAVFGNGYNSANENAVLYIVDVVTGALIRKIVLNPYATATLNSNGLSAPAVVDTDGDYIADYIFAGDLRGNLWKVDVTSANADSWDSAYKSGTTPKPLFAAVDGSGTPVAQPITVRPEVGKHPDGLSGYMVYFGTGRYVANGDNASGTVATPLQTQTFYGVWDKPYTGSGTPVARANLLPQTLSETMIGTKKVRGVTADLVPNWDTGGTCGTATDNKCLGCRVDLLTPQAGSLGEKQVSNPVLLGGALPRVIFTTLIPESAVCTAGGTSWLMELNPRNCGRLPAQVFDIDGDGTVTDDTDDLIGGTVPVAGINPGIGIMPEPTIIRDTANKTDLKAESGSTGAVMTIKNYVGGTSGGRQSWRQLK